MLLRNLTPHPINILGENGLVITIKNEGTPARVAQDITETNMSLPLTENISINVYLKETKNSKITNLPEPEEGTVYIVSTLVAQLACRPDVIAPLTDHTAERDETDNIIGVRGFRRFV